MLYNPCRLHSSSIIHIDQKHAVIIHLQWRLAPGMLVTRGVRIPNIIRYVIELECIKTACLYGWSQDACCHNIETDRSNLCKIMTHLSHNNSLCWDWQCLNVLTILRLITMFSGGCLVQSCKKWFLLEHKKRCDHVKTLSETLTKNITTFDKQKYYVPNSIKGRLIILTHTPVKCNKEIYNTSSINQTVHMRLINP